MDKAEELVTLQKAVHPTLGDAARLWFRIGILSFGGPAAQIALMHRFLVEETRWLREKTFLDALSFCMLLPGPEAMQLATYAGWRLHGVRGGLIAGLLFVLPGALIVLILAALYGFHGDLPLVDTFFFGIKAAVIVIVVQALVRIAGRALSSVQHRLLAVVAFIGIFFLDVPFPLVVLGAAVVGALLMGQRKSGDPMISDTDAGNVESPDVRSMLPRTARTIVIWMLVWWIPIAIIDFAGFNQRLVDIGNFFSTLAVVTFGGAYAVLAYLAQDVVNQHGWLTTTEMMDGLALAETTPGPLILVTEFVGYLAAFRDGGWAAGVQGALLTLWVTFVPCFLWIFAGAPYLEWVGAQPRLRAALAAITAAVVGVIFNLSLWFALHVVFGQVDRADYGPLTLWLPKWSTLDWRAVCLIAIGSVLIFRLKWSVLQLLASLSVAGVFLLMI